jgi:hypothetical protein
MIKRAIELRLHINLICSYTYKDDFRPEMQLNDDRYILLSLAAALVHFEHATISLRGQAKAGEFGVMGGYIPIIEVLSIELTELQHRLPLDTTFASTELYDLPNCYVNVKLKISNFSMVKSLGRSYRLTRYQILI